VAASDEQALVLVRCFLQGSRLGFRFRAYLKPSFWINPNPNLRWSPVCSSACSA